MTKINWHPYPKEKPKKTGHYLVCDEYLKRHDDAGIRVSFWMQFEDGIWGWSQGYRIIAWAELPEPYSEDKE